VQAGQIDCTHDLFQVDRDNFEPAEELHLPARMLGRDTQPTALTRERYGDAGNPVACLAVETRTGEMRGSRASPTETRAGA
jgi:hypothetical protein